MAPSLRRLLRCAGRAAASVVVTAGVAACATAAPAPPAEPTTAFRVPASANAVLSALRSEALRQGGWITSETTTSFTADYGVQVRHVRVPTDDGLGKPRDVLRETEVHTSVTYSARDTDDGAFVSLAPRPIYWHPDLRVWLPAPDAAAPWPGVLQDLTSGAR